MVGTLEGEPVADPVVVVVVVVGIVGIGTGTEMEGGVRIEESFGFWDCLVAGWSEKDPWQFSMVFERKESSSYCTWKLFKKVR